MYLLTYLWQLTAVCGDIMRREEVSSTNLAVAAAKTRIIFLRLFSNKLVTFSFQRVHSFQKITYPVWRPDSVLIRHPPCPVTASSQHHTYAARCRCLWDRMVIEVHIKQKEYEAKQSWAEAIAQASDTSNYTLCHAYKLCYHTLDI